MNTPIEWHEHVFPTHTFTTNHKHGKYNYYLSVIDNGERFKTYWQLHRDDMTKPYGGTCCANLIHDGNLTENNIEAGKQAVIDAMNDDIDLMHRIESIEDAEITDWESGSIEYHIVGDRTYIAENCFTCRAVTGDLSELTIKDRNGNECRYIDISPNTTDDELARIIAAEIEINY